MTGWGRSMVKLEHEYLWEAKGRHALYYYYRRDGQRIPIKNDGKHLRPGDPGFLAEYERIHATFKTEGRQAPGVGSLLHVINTYKASPKFTKLADRTKRDYLRITDMLGEDYGHLSIRTVTLEAIEALRDKWADIPRTANYRITVLALLLSFAQRRRQTFGLPAHWINPAIGWERLDDQGRGYPQWPENVILAFRKRAYPELRWLMETALYTGQRGQDCIAMMRAHFDGELIEVLQQKTGERLWIPAHKHLLAVFAEMPTRQLVLLTSPNGKPWKEDHYRHEIQDTVEACGFKGYSLHGLRKNAVTRLLEAGCTEYETASITGQSLPTVRKYAKAVNQRKLARSAITKLERSENGR